ncbi:DM13 domain-containing protein [Candidatus Nitrosotenuis cloacae]|uniref:DM13 domain-containing protein n=1 Tax=Candidatus Nitrosotenuis cloacae TaxID=1603555 RepID=UPI00227EFDA4|nr:DM13 domain-containing protein [Candidatus Nitrosotenuis cloacae]
MLRQVTIFVMVGTFLIGAYYVGVSSYVAPEQQNRLASSLDEFQAGLTYEKIVTLDERERATLVQSMPSGVVRMIMSEAKLHPSFVSESIDDIREQSLSDDVTFSKLTQIAGLKGYDASGTAVLVHAGSKTFLRLDEFGVTPGIDQRLYLTKDGSASSGIDLGLLKASSGSQNYDVSGIDLDEYNILIIYSKTLDTHYAHARLAKSDI